MNREQFLRNLKQSKVALQSLQIEGWEGVVYLRPQTMGEIRDVLMKEDAGESLPDVRSRLLKDPLYLARGIARLVRDEGGVLLFDPDDDEQMKVLMDSLADAAPTISRQVNETYNKLNAPNKVEVTPEGNSPSAKSS